MEIRDTIIMIEKIYNTLNGRINNNRSVILKIELDRDETQPIACITQGNYIIFNVQSIYRYTKNIKDINMIYTIILDVIAHELSHLDQLVDDRFIENKNYRRVLEYDNVDRTTRYILNNKEILEREFGFIVCTSYFTKRNTVFNGYQSLYEKDNMDIAVGKLLRMIYRNSEDLYTMNIFSSLNSYSDIILNSNFIKKDNTYININEINDILLVPLLIRKEYKQIRILYNTNTTLELKYY